MIEEDDMYFYFYSDISFLKVIFICFYDTNVEDRPISKLLVGFWYFPKRYTKGRQYEKTYVVKIVVHTLFLPISIKNIFSDKNQSTINQELQGD